ncbi:MAG: peptidoglycan DD-metalloendopeptidase family protein [Acidobacteria bacterium]|nr:peptidoglycan DD-metalloendopeptidase family protein [Acidobacteriota bacterium]
MTALFSLFLAIFLTIGLTADETEIQTVDKLKNEQDKLIILQKDVEELTTQVKDFESQENSLLEQVEKYQLMYNLRDAEYKGITQQSKTVELEIRKNEYVVAEINERIEKNLTYLKIRMRTLYKIGELNNLRLLLSLKSPSEVKKGMWYLSRLTDEDRKRILQMEKDQEILQKRLEELHFQREQTQELKSLLQKKRKQVKETLNGKQDLLESILDNKTKRQTALDELQKAKEQMGRLIEKLASGDINARVDIKLDIVKFKGLLNPPVAGVVKKKFGIETHPIFNIKIPHNGITYSVENGTEVKSVFNGKVIYSKRFRGYGNLVIVDHGHKYLSFYAHLLKPLVNVGESVIRNQTLALSGESGSLEGPQLYFELLYDGKPIDPMLWFKSKE